LTQKSLRFFQVRKEFWAGAVHSEKPFPREAHFFLKALRKFSFLLVSSWGFVHRCFLLLSHEQTFFREESSAKAPLAGVHGAWEEVSTGE
jgi:hypothetical protein